MWQLLANKCCFLFILFLYMNILILFFYILCAAQIMHGSFAAAPEGLLKSTSLHNINAYVHMNTHIYIHTYCWSKLVRLPVDKQPLQQQQQQQDEQQNESQLADSIYVNIIVCRLSRTHTHPTHAHIHPAVRGSHVNVMQTPSPSVPLPIAVLLYVSQLAISFFVYVSRFACDIIINKIKAKWKCCCCCCLCCFCCCLCCRCPRWCISAGLQCDLRR